MCSHQNHFVGLHEMLDVYSMLSTTVCACVAEHVHVHVGVLLFPLKTTQKGKINKSLWLDFRQILIHYCITLHRTHEHFKHLALFFAAMRSHDVSALSASAFLSISYKARQFIIVIYFIFFFDTYNWYSHICVSQKNLFRTLILVVSFEAIGETFSSKKSSFILKFNARCSDQSGRGRF